MRPPMPSLAGFLTPKKMNAIWSRYCVKVGSLSRDNEYLDLSSLNRGKASRSSVRSKNLQKLNNGASLSVWPSSSA